MHVRTTDGRREEKKGGPHPRRFLPNAAVATSDEDGLPRLIRDVLRSPGRLGREEQAECPDGFL
jgi:hypothetical protein